MFDDESTTGRLRCEVREGLYRRGLWWIWPKLLVITILQEFTVCEEIAWRQRWGTLGVELYHCFVHGDRNIRCDMINRAKEAGMSEFASRLERWRSELANPA